MNIFVTGHSLGGALALFAALDIKKTFAREVTLYTYGQPRVGNKVFSDYVFSFLDESYVRLVNSNDPVPKVPPTDYNFKHAGNEVWYNGAKWNECPNEANTYENSRCSNSISSPIWAACTSHLNMRGIKISGLCDSYQTSVGLLSGQEILDTESYAKDTYIID